MPINGMMPLITAGAASSTAYRYDLAGYTATYYTVYVPGAINISSINLAATVGSAPSINVSTLTGSVLAGNWHSSGSVTAPIRSGIQMRLSYTSGVNSYLTGSAALGVWTLAVAGTPPAYSWDWLFFSSVASGTGYFLLEMRDAVTLVVYDSATLTVVV